MGSTANQAARIGRRRPPAVPRNSLLFGNLSALQRDPLAFFVGAHREYGDVVRYRLALFSAYLVAHPDHVKRVLQDNHTNYTKDVIDYKVLGWIVEQGVLLSDGPLWLRQRRLMQPAFHRQRIAGLGAMMAQVAGDLAETWAPAAARGEVVDVGQAMTAVTMRVVGRALFSADVGEAVDTVGRSFSALDADLIRRFRSGMIFPPVLPTPRDRAFRANRKALDGVVDGIIQARRTTGQREDDLLQMLLEARDEETGEGMTDDQLRAEVKTLLLAGHETTANSLAWVWYLLSQHPEAEAQLHAELDEVLGGRLPGLDDLPRLVYTRMVFDEALRLYPPAWLVARRASEADTLGPYEVGAGSAIIISTYVTHRHKEFWDDPERFDPERFRPGRAEKYHRYAYFPFGGGPRQCIGNTFAQMEATLILATLAQRYRLRLAPNHPPVEPLALITLQQRHGLHMSIEER
jgi:cytochrome P450